VQEGEKEEADAHVREPDEPVGVGLVRREARLELDPGDEGGNVDAVEEGLVREREDDEGWCEGEEEDGESLGVWLTSRASVHERERRGGGCERAQSKVSTSPIVSKESSRTEHEPPCILVDDGEALLALKAEGGRACDDDAGCSEADLRACRAP